MTIKDKIQKIIAQEIAAIQSIPITENIEEAVNLIHKSVHQNSGKLIVSGVGKAGEVGANIATTFSSTVTPAVFIHPVEALHGNLGLIQKNDILLVITNSGKTREILELIPIAKNLVAELPVITMTGAADSPAAKLADVTLSTGAPEEVCPLGLTPTTSTTTMTVLGDILIVLMMEKIGVTPEEYGKRHHGGYLGAKARKTSY